MTVVVALLGFALIFQIPMSFAQSGSVTFYAYNNTATINSGDVTNTTKLFSGTAYTITSDAVTNTSGFFASWDNYPCLTSSGFVINAGNIVFTAFISSNASLTGAKFEGQVGEYASCGTGSGTVLFGGAYSTSVNIGTTTASYSVSVPASSQTTIPSGYVMNFAVYVFAPSSHPETITVSYGSAADDTKFVVPASPVVVNSLSLSAQSIESGQTSIATVSVSDPLGLYDIAQAQITASFLGATPINLASMTPSSSNAPSSGTGTWTYTINPLATSYAQYSGDWNIQSTLTDNSGNTYASGTQILSYQTAGVGTGGGTQTTQNSVVTTASRTSFGINLTNSQFELLIILLIVIISIAAFVARRR